METPDVITTDRARRAVLAVHRLHEDVARYFRGCGPEPINGSVAANDMLAISDAEKVRMVWITTALLIEAAADHVMAIVKTLTEPVQTIAPWASARAVFECSALVCWLADTSVAASERIGRNIAWRCKGLREQRNYADALPELQFVQKAEEMIQRRQKEAGNLGCSIVPVPSFTDLVGTQLHMEAEYRLFSSLVHPHNWALQQVAFQRVMVSDTDGQTEDPGPTPLSYLEKAMSPEVMLYLCLRVAKPFVRAISAHCGLLGHDVGDLTDALRPAWDELHASDS